MTCPPENLRTLCESLLWPLNVFYSRYERDLPTVTPLFARQLPGPVRTLLAHEDNMTPTLETFHNARLVVERLHNLPTPGETTREVVLRTESGGRPVEYGASRVFLRDLPAEAVTLLEAGRVPLGTILRDCHCAHRVEPAGYFRLRPTGFLCEVLEAPDNEVLYGRRTRLIAAKGPVIAEVCEVLPPLPGESP